MLESLIKKINETEKRDHTGAPTEGKADKVQETDLPGDKCSILAFQPQESQQDRNPQSTDLISLPAPRAPPGWYFSILYG